MRAILVSLILCVPWLTSAAPVLPSRSFVQEFDTIAQLLASNPQQLTTTYTCKGLNAVNDGLGGNFYYFSGDTTATNETDCFEFSNGRLRRFYEAVTASRILVTGGPAGTNYANNLGIGESMIIAYVIPTLGSVGNAAVFDGSGRITNGVVTPTISDGTNTLVQQLGPFTVDYYPIAIATNKLGDGHLYKVGGTNVGFNGQFIWGPGTTNVLYRSGTDLIYTNGVTSGVSLQVKDGNAAIAYFGTDAGGNAAITASSGKTVKITPNLADTYFATSTDFYPNSTNKNLGFFADALRWGNFQQAGTHYQYGHLSGTGLTNYARIASYHSGTNGAAIYDSQSAGAAGTPRPMNFQIGSTNIVILDGNSGANTTGLLVLENGTQQRVTIGAADSGGAGFRVLRIPN